MNNLENKIEKIVDKVLNETITPRIEKIKNKIVSEKKKEKWIQDIDMKEGSFTDYCSGKVTCECVEKAQKEGGKPSKMANLYLNMNKNKCKSLRESTQELDEMDEFYEIAKQRKLERDSKKETNEEETMEQSAFVLAADAAKDAGKKEFEFPEGSGKMHPVTIKQDIKSESTKKKLQLTEKEMIDLIERIVIEQKIQGVKQQDKSMKETEKENSDYVKSVKKKMKDYLKDGSEGEYDMNPKKFPQGNKEIKDDVVKKYTPTSDQEEYLETVVRMNGIENMDYDNGFEPNDEWMELSIEGGSETGNNPEWGNAVETDINKDVNKRRELKTRQKIKSKSYQKDSQPIEPKNSKYTDTALSKLGESKEDKKVIQEIDKMKKLFSHNYKTQ